MSDISKDLARDFIPAQEGGPLRSFGRIKSRALKPKQQGLFDTLLPKLTIDEALISSLSTRDQVWLEIGFGGGEHMASQAFAHEEVLILGCEPFINGIGSALRHIDERQLNNVRIWPNDARMLLDQMPEACIERVFILFPDPWPKARHQKRRLVQDETIKALARVLKEGGRLRFATDWAHYADEALARFLDSGLFIWPAERASDWSLPPKDHITTRYELKKLGDCAPVFIDMIKSTKSA